MKVLARYDDGDGVLAGIYVCELSEEEMLLITQDPVAEGNLVDVPNLVEAQREVDKQLDRARRILRQSSRYEALLAMLTQEIEQARLSVSLKEIPDIKIAHALTDALSTLINGQHADSDH